MSEKDVALGRIKHALDEINEEVSHGIYPASTLTDFKHSVDLLRLTIWAVIEAEEQRKNEVGGRPMGLDKKMIEFRIKRLEQMLSDLRSDLARSGMDVSDLDLKNLAVTLGTTLHSVTRLANRKA
jgi:hypothetical protein